MFDFKACTVCLSTNVQLKNLDNGNLREEFNSASGLKTRKGNGLPPYLCVVCLAILKKTKHFRERCQRANYTLQEILLRNGEITESNIQAINKASIGIAPSLTIMERNKAAYEVIQFPVLSRNSKKSSPIVKNISILHFSFNTGDTNNLPAFITTRQDTESTKQEKPQEPPPKKTKIFEEKNVKIEIVGTQNNFDNISFEQINYDSKTEKQYFDESTSNIHDNAMDNYFDDDHNDGDNNIDFDAFASSAECKLEKPTDTKLVGSNLEEEYALMVPISLREAKAAVEVYNMFGTGRCKCNICGKAFMTDKRLKIHTRMHDKHISGLFYCELCSYYYKTEYLLNSHMTEKHMYKYVCRKCPEVNFDRMSAKQHFIWNHLQSGTKRDANWYESRPTWLSTRGGKRVKGLATIRPVRKVTEPPSDFLKYSAVAPLEQYQLIRDRRSTRNYIESPHKCELCYRGFRELLTYSKHMKKHDPVHSGPLQCDMCKLHFKSPRHLYRHMIITHLARYSCQLCDFVCYNKGQANQHYRWHKNVTYACTQCDKVFKKHTTRLTHMRIKHPTTELCNICGHSFVSEAGLYFHKRKAHNREEIEAGEGVKVELESRLYCEECQVQFLSDAAFGTHLGSSSKHAATNLSIQNNALGNKRRRENTSRRADGKVRQSRSKRASDEIINNGLATGTDCEVCGVRLTNDVQARKHYASDHPGTEFLKRYMCDVCGHTTKQYANLLVHMRTHTREKPYSCPHCDRRFSMPSNRDRHLVVHTGEKRYECEHCHRRFTQSSAVKLHIQTVHLKIPYAPWDKKNRKRRKDVESTIVPPQPKLMLDATGEYINAYITYNDV